MNKTPLTNLWICLKRKRKTANEILEYIARSKLLEKMILSSKEFKIQFFESLILAQDERWRRA